MNLDRDYIEYVGESSLALLAVSAFYLFNPGNPVTYLALLLVPALFGYTAYISRDGFNKASLLSGISVIFIPLGFGIGLFGAFLLISNPLVSYFSSGKGFSNYSSSTYIPMLLSGLIIGLVIFGASESQQQLKQEISSEMSGTMGNLTSDMVRETGLIQQQKEAASGAMMQTSENTVILTQEYVMNDTEDLNQQARISIAESFSDAKEEVPERYQQRIEEQNVREDMNISRTVQSAGTNLLSSNFYVIIILSTLFFYTLNPVFSILTGIFGQFYQFMGEL